MSSRTSRNVHAVTYKPVRSIPSAISRFRKGVDAVIARYTPSRPGCQEETTTLMPHPPACDGEAVITVAELLALTGAVVLPAELDRMRQLIPQSRLRDVLGDVVSAAIDSFRRELAASIPAFHPPPRLGGCFTTCRLDEVPGATVDDAFSALGALSTLRIVRVTHCDIVIACIEDPTTGRFYELDGDLQSWLHGEEQSPGDPEFWIGEPIDDFTRADLHPTGPHTYLLTPTQVPPDAVPADLVTTGNSHDFPRARRCCAG